MDQSELKMERPCERLFSWTPLQLSEESRGKFFVLSSLSTGEAHVFGVKFIGLYGTVGFIAIRDFLFEEEAICGVTSGQRWMEWFPCRQRFLTTKQK